MKIGENKDITVTINHSVSEYTIEFIQQIEAELKKTLGSLGFALNTTSKGETVELNFWQFGKAN